MISRRNFLGLSSGLVSIAFFASPAMAEDEATRLLNEIRKQYRLPLLTPNAQLEKMAQSQANMMAEKTKVAHTLGWGNDFASRLRKFNIHGAAGENLCAGQKDIASAYNVWMNSPGHRRNMLDPEFHSFGLAKASTDRKPGYLYWALVFGR